MVTKPISEYSDDEAAELSEEQIAEAVTLEIEREEGKSITAPIEDDTGGQDNLTPDPDPEPESEQADEEEEVEEIEEVEPEPTSDDGSDGEEQDADDSGTSLLQRARELGWDHDFETEEDFLAGVVNLRRFASRKVEHEELGQLAAERGLSIDELRAEAEQGDEPDPFRFRPPVKPNPEWGKQITMGEDGQLEGPDDLIREYQQYEQYKQDWWLRAGDDPEMILRNGEPFIEKAVERVLARREAKVDADRFVEEYKDFVKSAEFKDLLDEGLSPERAVELLSLRRGTPNPADPAEGGDEPPKDPKRSDIANARKKVVRRRQPNRRRVADVDWSAMSEEEMAMRSVAEAGIDIPPE